MQKSTKVCFVGLNAYSLFNKDTTYRFGGAEVHSYLYCKGLIQYADDIDLHYVVTDYGQQSPEIFDGVHVVAHSTLRFPAYNHLKRLQSSNEFSGFIKSFFKQLLRVYNISIRTFRMLQAKFSNRQININDYKIPYDHYEIYEQIDAEVYCTMLVSNLSATLAEFCRINNKPFILFIQSDGDLSLDYKPKSKEFNIYKSRNDLCYFTIQQADTIVVQTDYQAKILKERFGRTSQIVKDPIDFSSFFASPQYNQRETVLWIGKSNKNKQPEVLIDLAQRFPDIQFVMIMNRYDDKRSQEIIEAAPANVKIYEFVPYHEVEKFFAEAFVFINTSGYEGFPNTFLQAGKYSVPVLSYIVNPDEFITEKNCGIVANGDFEQLVDRLKTIRENQSLAQTFSMNIYNYVEANHSLERKVEQLAALIKEQVVQ